MSLSAFEFTDRARPIIEVGVGDTRVDVGLGRWDTSRWDDPAATWSGAEVSWRDVSCEAISVHCEYGRRRTTERYVAGAATVVVDNATGWADPYAATGPAAQDMRPGRSIRIGVAHATLGTRWLFYGFIDAMQPVYSPVQADTVALQCIDALGEVNRAKVVPLGAPDHAGEWTSDRINRLLDLARWPATARDVALDADTLIADDLGGQLADLLGQTADSAGGSIWGDTQGRITYRYGDWQAYDPATPPEATIGNVGPLPDTPGYLTPASGLGSTPDVPLIGPVRFIVRARLDAAVASGYGTLIAQRGSGSSAFAYQLAASSAGLILRQSTNGTTITNTNMGPVTVGAEATYVADTTVALFNSTAAVVLGGRTVAGSDLWPGRIYSARMEQLDGAGNPTAVLWSWDASDYVSGTSMVSGGRTWTLTSSAAITPMVPGSAGDVCPVEWERPFERADFATRVIIGRDPATALTFDDLDAQLLYGIEPFERVDLLTQSDQLLSYLGQRILKVRSALSAPRVRSVTLNAATAANALDLMTTADVYKPSRYRCRLSYPRGEVFDAQHFATAVVHDMTADAWTLQMNLDLAAPWAGVGGRWDAAGWDQAMWAA
ncbi:MAG: hypothetical protein ABW022_06440 [Actinoplanes sp.]